MASNRGDGSRQDDAIRDHEFVTTAARRRVLPARIYDSRPDERGARYDAKWPLAGSRRGGLNYSYIVVVQITTTS